MHKSKNNRLFKNPEKEEEEKEVTNASSCELLNDHDGTDLHAHQKHAEKQNNTIFKNESLFILYKYKLTT